VSGLGRAILAHALSFALAPMAFAARRVEAATRKGHRTSAAALKRASKKRRSAQARSCKARPAKLAKKTAAHKARNCGWSP
jgi:hypothetical protein